MDEGIQSVTAWLEAASAHVAEGKLPYILLTAAAFSLLAIAVLGLVRLVFHALHRRIAALQGTRIHAIRYRDQEFFTPAEVTVIIVGLLRLVRYAAYAFVIYVYLLFVFGLFGPTRTLANTLLGYFTGAAHSLLEGAIAFVPSLIFLIVLFFVTRSAIHLMQIVFQRLWTGRVRIASFPKEFAQPTYKILRFLIVIFAIMVAYPYLPGAKSPAFQAVSIFLGVLVSLGSSGAIANIVSGIALTYMQAFKIGDRVKIAEAVGDVIEKNTIVTRVRTPKNVDITIPNAMVMSNHIINFSSQAKAQGVILHTTVTIGYDVDWARVHELMIESALETDAIEAEPKPFVLQTRLDDFYVHYELNAYTREPKRTTRILSDLHQNLQNRLHAAGIEIASPHLAKLRDGHRPDIPDPYLPSDAKPGGFRILPWGSGGTGG